MMVESVTLSQFRNYESLQLDFHPGINLILGENAQGKTNLLEALYLCAALRSFRTRKDSEFIRFGASQGYLKMNLITTQSDTHSSHQMEMMFRPDQKKRVKKNGISQQRVGDVMGTFKAVLFSPEDLKIVKDSPSERRQFMDSEMVQVSPRYYHTLLQYQKIMKHRNQLLKTKAPKEEELKIWDLQLSEFGGQLMLQRHHFLKAIGKWAQEIHHSLTGKKETLAIHYQPGLPLPPQWPEKSPEALAVIMENLLEKNRRADLYRQTTGKGPHRDDLAFTINQMDVRQYGSQGQKRTVVLSLKLAVLEWMKEMAGEYPVLLLDDVTSELDEGRQRDLLEYLKPVQTIITATHQLPGMEEEKRGRLYFVEKGRVSLSKKV